MRTIIATVLASSLLVSSAIAADAPSQPLPLSPGKPAGVKQADIEAGGVVLWLGVAALAAGIAVIASQTQGSGNSSATTTQ
jgi:hypothetical protein